MSVNAPTYTPLPDDAGLAFTVTSAVSVKSLSAAIWSFNITYDVLAKPFDETPPVVAGWNAVISLLSLITVTGSVDS